MSAPPLPAAERGLRWLRDQAAPLWLERGLDRARGGYVEALDHERAENTADFRRLRVTVRQIYAFSAAVRLGVPDAREGLDHGLDFLLGPARHPDWGFANRFDLDGRITDECRDLYDLAFVCFALAHAYDVTRDPALRDEAEALLKDIRAHLRHPAGGFDEAAPPRQPRRQNPHMHLLEACLAWARLTPGGAFEAEAHALLRLFSERLFQAKTGALPEHFADDWSVLTSGGPVATEPGHHFEWVWLLHEAEEIGLSLDATDTAGALYAFAHRYGVDAASGLPFGEVSDQGRVLSRPVRLWPAAEWTKAEVVFSSAPGGSEARVEAAWSGVERFLNAAPPGLWREHWGPDEGFLPGPSPASSLYHIAMAIEVMQAASAQKNPATRAPAGKVIA